MICARDRAHKPGAGEFRGVKWSGGCPAGSGRALRLDPFALPVRFSASDAAPTGGCAQVELHRERVVVRALARRHAHGAQYAGDGLRRRRAASSPSGEGPATLAVVLDTTRSRARRCRFSSRPRATRRWREWQSLGRACSACRCWSTTRATACASRSARLGALRSDRCARAAAAAARRASGAGPRSCCAARRGRLTGNAPVHRGEREIIARN